MNGVNYLRIYSTCKCNAYLSQVVVPQKKNLLFININQNGKK